MLKKLLTLFVAFAFIFAPSGLLGVDEASAAKSYKSGKKSFTNTNSNDTMTNSTTNKQSTTSTPQSPAKSPSVAKPSSGGFMKGLIFGGLAGLLLGSMLDDLGFLGTLLALFINILAVVGILMIVRKLYLHFANERKKKDYQAWKR